jgi:hypothetical protein
MIGPCMDHIFVAHVVLAIFSGLNILLGAWLAHRRKLADKDRRRFYTQMRVKHGLKPETPQDIVDRITLKREP